MHRHPRPVLNINCSQHRVDCEALLRACIFVFSVNDDDDSDNDGEEDGKEGDVRD